MNQTTLKDTCIISGGVGLHSGLKSNILFHPAPVNHGIVFYRSDKAVSIPANYKFAKPSPLCTTIENDGIGVSTIEHLLSVCNGMGVDNLLIELETEEVPILDGSGSRFHIIFKQTGLKQLEAPRKIIKILDVIKYEDGDILIYATPSEEPNITFSVDFDHKQIGQQEYSFQFTEKNYEESIVGAKTFGFMKDVASLQQKGLIKGGSKNNAIILNENGDIENMEVMTWLNEPNLHKVLDQIGDFYLANNLRIIGNIFSHKSGHASHLAFIKYMMEECQDRFTIVDEY